MSRFRIITSAVLLAFIGAIIPLFITLYISWKIAVDEDQKILREIGNRIIDRTVFTLNQAQIVLNKLNKQPFKPCSTEHIKLMQNLTLNIISIEEIGYFDGKYLKCTSWGLTPEKIAQSPTDFVLANGLKISTQVKPLVGEGNIMTSLNLGQHNVLINPFRFVDIIVNSPIQAAVLTSQGAVLGTFSDPNLKLVRDVYNQKSRIDKNNTVAVIRSSGLIAVVIGSREALDTQLYRELMLLLPLGFVMAAFIVGLVFWFLKHRLSPLGELTLAVENKEFVVFYQPIIDLKSKRCVGAEALIKWLRPNGEIIQPDFFIPLAEESGLIMPITDQIVESVISEMQTLLEQDPALHIAINLAVEDIKTGRILTVVNKALENTTINKNQIWLEATERGFMDVDSAYHTIIKARELGYIVAIDDFGTGYSSLATLQNFPLNILKIDKSFVNKIGTSSVSSDVTPHIIDIAKTLKLEIVAEGIENQQQAEYLHNHCVKYGQGWFFSKALLAREFIHYYHHNRLNLPDEFSNEQ